MRLRACVYSSRNWTIVQYDVYKVYFLDDLFYITILETQYGPTVLTFLSVWPFFRVYTAIHNL
jgi:hypothetical protein